MDNENELILRIALDTPLRRVFDYLPPPCGVAPGGVPSASAVAPTFRPGIRVRVPFGRRQLIGVLVDVAAGSDIPTAKLRAAVEVLDAEPVFDPVTLELLRFAADYYHHPIGEVIAAALPAALRDGQAPDERIESWGLTALGRSELQARTSRRPRARQRAVLSALAERGPAPLEALGIPVRRAELARFAEHGWVEATWSSPSTPLIVARPPDVALTDEQARVVAAIRASKDQFAAHLLYGVTGSGKTEVYLRAIEAVLEDAAQALVLVPEIALTPQLVARFRARFSAGIAVLHSGLSKTERRDAWRSAHLGRARIVIGARSAIFTSLPRLRLIVVDEEHDASYKQQEGFRYSARDLAVWRAQRAGIPVLLGSATPSLETLDNAAQGRYTKWRLPQRPGESAPPHLALVDLRKCASEQGLSQPAMQAMSQHLESGGQIIVFLNRRGYAPALFCTACGWAAACAHCDARLTLHRRAAQLRCHHCGAVRPVPAACGACAAPLNPVGQGTERIEETLTRLFPEAPLARLDRDTAGGRGAMETLLERVASGAARILVGTQMITKGHHFPEVSLVLVLDADQGLFASDFRATERLAQTIIQVAGRAGRGARSGEVLIQTAFPEHPLLTRLIAGGYEDFALRALEERRAAGWPPYSRLALLRGEARDEARLDEFLRAAGAVGTRLAQPAIKVLGPAPALMARRADHYRAHILVEALGRVALQRFLKPWLSEIERLPGPPNLRWSIDVDPLEVD